MLNDDDRKLLTEFLGEPYFESDGSYYLGGLYTDGNLIPMRSFTTWQDTGDLKKKLVEMGVWPKFYWWSHQGDRGIVGGNNHEAWHVNWLMDPIRFPELVVGWLKEGTKK